MSSIDEKITTETDRLERAIEAEIERMIELQRKKAEEEFIRNEAIRRLRERGELLPEHTRALSLRAIEKERKEKDAEILEQKRKDELELCRHTQRIRAEADVAAQEKLRLLRMIMDERKAAALTVWLQNPCNVDDGSNETKGLYTGWTNATLEPEFWKMIDSCGGFSKCPTCNSVPLISNTYTRHYHGNQTTVYTTGLWCKVPEHCDYTSFNYVGIANISCCEHLFDFKMQRRYVMESAMKIPIHQSNIVKMISVTTRKPTFAVENTHTSRGQHEQSYVLYNKDDPFGEIALAEQERLNKLKQIEQLRAQLELLEQTP